MTETKRKRKKECLHDVATWKDTSREFIVLPVPVLVWPHVSLSAAESDRCPVNSA